MTDGEKILFEIKKDKEQAEKYLLSGIVDNSPFSLAAQIAEKALDKSGKCLLRARREVEHKKRKNKKSTNRWVVQTQFAYEAIARENGAAAWMSEGKIKREWKSIVDLAAEIAVRIKNRGAGVPFSP